MDSLTLRKKYEKSFAERDSFLAGKPLPEQASEACWKTLAQMTPAEALAFRRTEESKEEKVLRLLGWRRNPRNGITQALLVAPHIYKGADGTDTNANISYFGTVSDPIPSVQELAWLSDVSWTLGISTDISRAFRKTYSDDSGEGLAVFGGLTCRTAMALLAIGHLFLEKKKALLFDISGEAYVIPFKKLFDAKTFIYEKLEAYRDPRAYSAIQSYVEGRWANKPAVKGFSATAFTQKAFYSDMQEEVGAQNADFSPFYLDGFETLTQTAALNVKSSKLENLQERTAEHFEGRAARRFETAFWDLMSEGITDVGTEGQTAAEPYRWRVLEYMLLVPLKIRATYATGRPAYEDLCGATGPQGMPILVGHQGIGKSTLVQRLALGWAGTVHDPGDTESQATVYTRAQNAVVEYPELEMMSGRQIGHLKSGTTAYSAAINLKYQNGITHFKLKALMIGTTNGSDFLADLSGSRRFWPIMIDHFDRQKTTDTYILTLLGNAQLWLNRELDRLLADGTLKAARALLSLEFPESEEDRAFKADGYSRLNPQTNYLEDFLKQLIASPQLYPKAYFGQHDGFWLFGSKHTLEDAFASWLKGADADVKVYPSTLTELLFGLPHTKKSAVVKVGGKATRCTLVSQADLPLFDPVPPTPTQQASRPAYTDSYAELNGIAPEMEDYYKN